jgi:hypothetical protein
MTKALTLRPETIAKARLRRASTDRSTTAPQDDVSRTAKVEKQPRIPVSDFHQSI